MDYYATILVAAVASGELGAIQSPPLQDRAACARVLASMQTTHGRSSPAWKVKTATCVSKPLSAAITEGKRERKRKGRRRR